MDCLAHYIVNSVLNKEYAGNIQLITTRTASFAQVEARVAVQVILETMLTSTDAGRIVAYKMTPGSGCESAMRASQTIWDSRALLGQIAFSISTRGYDILQTLLCLGGSTKTLIWPATRSSSMASCSVTLLRGRFRLDRRVDTYHGPSEYML